MFSILWNFKKYLLQKSFQDQLSFSFLIEITSINLTHHIKLNKSFLSFLNSYNLYDQHLDHEDINELIMDI